MLKSLLTATILAFAPALAAAQCGHQQQAMSCADGFVLDTDTGTCVASTTS